MAQDSDQSEAPFQAESELNFNTSAARASDSEEQCEEEDDYTSSSGSSTEDDDGQSSEEDTATAESQHLPGQFKPNNELKSRLTTFLPQLKHSNQELEALDDVHSRSIEARDDEQHYVEMDLALGVLAERPPGNDVVKTQNGNSNETSSDLESDATSKPTITVGSRQGSAKKAKIQEI